MDNRPAPVVLRGALLLAAVIACAWFALGAVQTSDQNRATDLIDSLHAPSRAQTTEILGLLDTAGTLNPDRNIDLLRAQALIRSGHADAGLAVARRVVAAEPDNIDAWTVLGFAARPAHPAQFRHAEAELRRLAPPVPLAP
ncbi:MAG TPA: tetratricopeptide repeat protein [Solirubrobacteraceae bacterium]|nr:tetratricopeptide repeat protein [Solirubrobacteraceae bacterium]